LCNFDGRKLIKSALALPFRVATLPVISVNRLYFPVSRLFGVATVASLDGVVRSESRRFLASPSATAKPKAALSVVLALAAAPLQLRPKLSAPS
jgi:hypothetical protein